MRRWETFEAGTKYVHPHAPKKEEIPLGLYLRSQSTLRLLGPPGYGGIPAPSLGGAQDNPAHLGG